MSLERKRKEALPPKDSGLGIFEETDPLRKVLMWGEPGAEAALGQMLPKEESCFLDRFDVQKARLEFSNARQMLEREGVEVVLVKDLFAQMIGNKDLHPQGNFDQLRSAIRNRALMYRRKYDGQISADTDEVMAWVDAALMEDVARYGEPAAVLMNEVLSLENEFPLANALYARDQSNLMGTTLVWSSMRHNIRQPEVHLYRTVLNNSRLLDSANIAQVQVVGSGRFEGGDGIANGGYFYVGVGGRSNLEGAMQAAASILRRGGGRVMIPIDHERDLGDRNEMDTMHLDTMWMPCGPNEIVACEDEVNRRRLLEVTGHPEYGGLKIEPRGWFADHLAARGVDLVSLTKEEQEAFAPNFLNIGEGKIILSLGDGNHLTEDLSQRGKTVLNADLREITRGYGGLHCMTAGIKRG